MDDLDELLGGLDRLELGDPDGLLLDPLEEFAGELEVDVGLEEDAPNFPQPFLDVRIGQDTAAAEFGEDARDLVGELVKHRAKNDSRVGGATQQAWREAERSVSYLRQDLRLGCCRQFRRHADSSAFLS